MRRRPSIARGFSKTQPARIVESRPPVNRERTESGVHARVDLVLVADDSPDTRAVYYGFFDAEGFLVEEASDGLAAIAKAIISRPDAIVLDYSMPRMDGAE